MNKTLIRIISLILSCLLVISFVGCDSTEGKKPQSSKPSSSNSDTNSKNDVSSEEDNSSEEKTAEDDYSREEVVTDSPVSSQNVKTVSLFDASGEPNFRLMRGSESSAKTIEAVSELRDLLKKRRISVDYKIDKVEEDNDLIEVLIGDTNRKESATAKKELEENREYHAFDFIIKFSNNKLCIIAGSDFVIQDAIDQFVKDFMGSKTVSIPENYTVIYENNKKIVKTTIGYNSLQNYVIVRPRYNLSYIIGKEITTLQEDIYKNNGFKVEIVKDNQAENDYEIIIGNAKRNGVQSLNSGNEYHVRVEGKKVFINGGNEVSTAAAVQKFTEKVNAGGNIVSFSGTADATAENYKMVWNEEFDGNSLDTNTWNYVKRHMASQTEGYMTNFTTKEEYIYVKDGVLHMVGAFDGEEYYGSEIDTKKSMWYQYGYVEISARVPGQKGMVPAFWSRGAGREIWPEIDFFECLGDPTKIKGTLLGWPGGEINTHGWTSYTVQTEKFPKSASYYKVPLGENLYDEFHTIGFYWDTYSAVWTCDGVEYARCDELTASEKYSATFHTPIHLLLSMQTAIAGTTFPPPDETTDWTKGDFAIDYIRLYQTDGQTLSLRQ